MKWQKDTFRIEGAEGASTKFYIVGAIGLFLTALGINANQEVAMHSYLTSFMFWMTIAFGALFFTLVHHLVNAKWSVLFRRIAEQLISVFPIMAILFLPILYTVLSNNDIALYEWAMTEEKMETLDLTKQHLLHAKHVYLNGPFFAIRFFLYFLVWSVLAYLLRRKSFQQDEKHTNELFGSLKNLSGPGMVLFALTVTFASFDWLMTLNPYWFSTIFGVYIFAGSVVALMTFLTVLVTILKNNDVLKDEVTAEHYHDFGKLTFAFCVFWTFIAFSQFLLIWYGNLAEETIFYKVRWDYHNWKGISLLLVFGHFLVPLILLMSRLGKRNVKFLTCMAVWLLFIHYVDLKWLVFPTVSTGEAIANTHQFILKGETVMIDMPAPFAFHWTDLTSLVGIGGIFLGTFWKNFVSQPIVPVNDPYLEKSIHFHNINL